LVFWLNIFNKGFLITKPIVKLTQIESYDKKCIEQVGWSEGFASYLSQYQVNKTKKIIALNRNIIPLFQGLGCKIALFF
jgi:hypothetical protein